MLLLGTAKLCITPQIPVRMCGYATRTGCYDGVKEDLWLRVHRFKTDEGTLVIAAADLLWWNSEMISRIRPKVCEAFGLAEHEVVFTATHNHSGPGTGNNFTPLLETGDPSYQEFLEKQVMKGIEQAEKNTEPVFVYRCEGKCAMNVYRRVKTEKGVQMLPNYDVPADRRLTILKYLTESGQMKAVQIHYACHANLSNENVIQPDYPGVALRMLDEDYPGMVSLFLQGCTADLRPNSVLGDKFIPCDYERVLNFGKAFYEKCRLMIEKEGQKLQGDSGTACIKVNLPLDIEMSKEEVKARLKSTDAATRQWAEKVLEKDLRSEEKLEILFARIEGQGFFFMNAEVAQDYAAYARSIWKDALCSGYSNGMIGYLATKEEICEGGYEPVGSALYFALSGTYLPEIENKINHAMAEIIEK